MNVALRIFSVGLVNLALISSLPLQAGYGDYQQLTDLGECPLPTNDPPPKAKMPPAAAIEISQHPADYPKVVGRTISSAVATQKETPTLKIKDIYQQFTRGHHNNVSSEELLEILHVLKGTVVKAKSEKVLLGLRDRLRTFLVQKNISGEWTASDLFCMEVPLNFDLLILALQSAPELSAFEISEVTTNTQDIWLHMREVMKDINQNPMKPHMKKPTDRNVHVKILGRFIYSHLLNLGTIPNAGLQEFFS